MQRDDKKEFIKSKEENTLIVLIGIRLSYLISSLKSFFARKVSNT